MVNLSTELKGLCKELKIGKRDCSGAPSKSALHGLGRHGISSRRTWILGMIRGNPAFAVFVLPDQLCYFVYLVLSIHSHGNESIESTYGMPVLMAARSGDMYHDLLKVGTEDQELRTEDEVQS